MSNTNLSNSSNPLLTAFAKHLADRTPEQRRQGLIDAGILTKKGNVAEPYKGFITSMNRRGKK